MQIIEADAISKVNSEGLPMEVSLSKDLRHRNIVQMLDYATRVRKVCNIVTNVSLGIAAALPAFLYYLS